MRARFPAAFRPPAFASWASCPAREFRPSTVGLPTTRHGVPDPDGVSTFRTHETRPGSGALSTPGTAVFTRPSGHPGRRLPPLSGQVPITPVTASHPGS